MKRINKRSLFSIALALMLVFSVGFYSTLSPTTAWFTASGAAENDFDMDEILIDYAGTNAEQVSLNFQASTKIFDADERAKMFEHTAQFYTVSANNIGARDVLITLDVYDYAESVAASLAAKGEAFRENGLHFFFFEYDPDASTAYTAAVVTEIVPGVYENTEGRRVISDGGSGFFRTSPSLVEAFETEMSGADYESLDFTSETDRSAFLTACESKTIPLAAGESKNICIAFWVEYDAFTAVAPGADGVRNVSYNIVLDVNSVQADYNSAP